MKKALNLALINKGKTGLNPSVGCIIIKNNKIISKGYHKFFGGPHAEIDAIKNAKESIKNTTMYITLEPCSHYGKTPPCVDDDLYYDIRCFASPACPGPRSRNMEAFGHCGCWRTFYIHAGHPYRVAHDFPNIKKGKDTLTQVSDDVCFATHGPIADIHAFFLFLLLLSSRNYHPLRG